MTNHEPVIILDDPRKSTSGFGPVQVIANAKTEPVRRTVNRLARGSFSPSGVPLPKERWKTSVLDAETQLLELLQGSNDGVLRLYARVTLTGTAFGGATGCGAYQAVAAEILNRAALAEIQRRTEKCAGER